MLHHEVDPFLDICSVCKPGRAAWQTYLTSALQSVKLDRKGY